MQFSDEEVIEHTNNVNYEKLQKKIDSYIHKASDLALIRKAYDYAAFKHKDQYRVSGEAYIIHPLEVACILTELHVGPNTLCAGLLHDVVEDTDATYEDIKELFSEDVASLVEGLTKIDKLQFSSLEKAQAVNHQKMLLAMAKDIRVIVVKLADRLHNMRTLDSMAPDKQVRISKETLEIYAPIADKLGIFKIKAELEDRSLNYIDHQMYLQITSKVRQSQLNRNGVVSSIIDDVKNVLDTSDINYTIKGRIKNTYSIYKKMVNQNKAFEDIYDVYAIRIIVEKVETCYQVLGLIHAHFTPIPHRFKDYIAVPKSNMYQSLHTTVIGPNGKTFEVQIRTVDMDNVAEYGIAAHWAYKENVEYSKDREQYEIAQKLKWYSDLLDVSKEEKTEDAEELVETIKTDILDANVYVYTPTGEVIDLPRGSTPLDFAYKIHTNLGNRTVGAIVNNKIVPLTYELKTGDIINIKTSKTSFGPSEDWLNIAKTSHARHKIRAFLNTQNHDIIVARGKSNLDKELEINHIDVTLDDKFASENFSKNNIKTMDDLYQEIGKGIISVKSVIAKLSAHDNDELNEEKLQKAYDRAQRILTTNSETGVVVEGLSNPKIKLANCCLPLPGDEIYGYVTKGNGIVVHRADCHNLKALEKPRLMSLEWATNISRKYQTGIKVTAKQRNNLLQDIINVISSQNVTLSSINAKNNELGGATVKVVVLISSLNELQTLIVNLKKVDGIFNIERDAS